MMFNQSSAGLDPRSQEARAYRIGEALVAAWRAEAQSYLKSTLNIYKRSITLRQVSKNHVIVSLSGTLPLMLELGVEPHDMRRYLLKTRRAGASPIRKVKSGPRKGQPYRYIMFRRSTRDIDTYGGRGARQVARRLSPSTSKTNGRLAYGSRYDRTSAHFLNKSGVRSTSGALDGMVRLEGGASTASTPASRSTYATWRTVSTLRPEAWQHAGFKALMLHRTIIKDAKQIAQAAGV